MLYMKKGPGRVAAGGYVFRENRLVDVNEEALSNQALMQIRAVASPYTQSVSHSEPEAKVSQPALEEVKSVTDPPPVEMETATEPSRSRRTSKKKATSRRK